MKIGYPCINRSIGCTSNSTFRLKSYSKKKLYEKIDNNLDCLLKIMKFNKANKLLFYRISSDLVPFASHPVNDSGWREHFHDKFRKIGDYIKNNDFRISMHPDQFNVINSKEPAIFERTKKELFYHAELFELMGLGSDSRIQVHVGGVYNDKKRSIERFIKRYGQLDELVKKYLAIENDDRSYTLEDCLEISRETGIPVIFDSFHHELNPSGYDAAEAIRIISKKWGPNEGIPMVDFSHHIPGDSSRKHAQTIDTSIFLSFLESTGDYDFDIMLEIKDKEKSALEVRRIVEKDLRFRG